MKDLGSTMCVCVWECVVIPFILDVRFVDVLLLLLFSSH